MSWRGKIASERHEPGASMRRRPRLKRPRWRLVLLAVACTCVWLRFYRRTVVAEALLDIPIRWPACAPDSAAHRAAPVKRKALDGARLVIISTWLPTRCGIATYSAGLRDGLLVTGASVDVVAVHLRSSEEHAYGSEARYDDTTAQLLAVLKPPACSQVVFRIRQEESNDYVLAAHFLVQQVCLPLRRFALRAVTLHACAALRRRAAAARVWHLRGVPRRVCC